MTHSRTIKGRIIYILLFECQILGTWRNLRQLCKDRNEIENFASYSKLSKEVALIRKDENALQQIEVITKQAKSYQIKIEVLK